jgi:hypothetical protein
MHRLPISPNSSPETQSVSEQARIKAEQRKQWRERLLLALICWPTLIYFSGIFDQVLFPVFHGTAPAPLFQIPSIIALISSIPLCFAVYHFYQREKREFRGRVSTTEATRAASYSVLVMAILNVITHLSQSIRDIVLAAALSIVVTLCIVMGFVLFYLLFHPPLDTHEQ